MASIKLGFATSAEVYDMRAQWREIETEADKAALHDRMLEYLEPVVERIADGIDEVFFMTDDLYDVLMEYITKDYDKDEL